ncbi:hypothetical protein BME24068_01664 [Burkholderia metallica]|nr:hypothetical protein BME24068_01664 [Burkholderia metallica]
MQRCGGAPQQREGAHVVVPGERGGHAARRGRIAAFDQHERVGGRAGGRIGADRRGQLGRGAEEPCRVDARFVQRGVEALAQLRYVDTIRRQHEQCEMRAFAVAGLDRQVADASLRARHALEVRERPRGLVRERAPVRIAAEHVERLRHVQREVLARAVVGRAKPPRMREAGNRDALLHVLAVVPRVEIGFVPGGDIRPDAELAVRRGKAGHGRFLVMLCIRNCSVPNAGRARPTRKQIRGEQVFL